MRHSILAAESVTELGLAARGAVLVVGSHAGLIAACLGAQAGAHALILNDAGVGMDGAGIAGLAYLQGFGMAGAAVAHTSARVGDGADSLARGVISHFNAVAAQAGVRAGMSAREAAALLAAQDTTPGTPPPYSDGRSRITELRGVEVWALDSVGKLVENDDGRILLIGSHGALHGGRPDSALNLHGRPVAARAALFNDAGVGIDAIGITRLPELARRGIPAATVACMSARIGEGRSMWESGVLSHVNPLAAEQGARPGHSAREWVESLGP